MSTRTYLKGVHVSVKNIKILNGVVASLPTGAPILKFEGLIVAWATLRMGRG